MAVKFIISSNPSNLSTALTGKKSGTVEAEFGDVLVPGTVITMAHHGKNADNPAPCSYANGCADEVEVVGLSHLDLDSIGGCAAILSRKPEVEGFWTLAAFVDVNGVHKLGKSGATPENIRRLNAYYAWAEANKVFAPRDGSASDVTKQVTTGIEMVERILADDPELLKAGEDFAKKEEGLNKASFIEMKNGVIVRVCGGFSNHLYVTPVGEVGRAVVALRTDFHAVTVSLADPIDGVNCREIVQALWGAEAGGHAGIAGGPRNMFMALDDLLRLRDATVTALEKAEEWTCPACGATYDSPAMADGFGCQSITCPH